MPADGQPEKKNLSSSTGRWTLLLVVLGIAVFTLFTPKLTRHSIAGYRKTVLREVQLAGGWDIIRRDCKSLVTNYPPNNAYRLLLGSKKMMVSEFSNNVFAREYVTNIYDPLPSGLATLQPRWIEFRLITNAPTVVRIKLFGTGKTDWTPYYGLLVVLGGDSSDYMPSITNGPGRVITKIADSIFEVHDPELN